MRPLQERRVLSTECRSNRRSINMVAYDLRSFTCGPPEFNLPKSCTITSTSNLDLQLNAFYAGTYGSFSTCHMTIQISMPIGPLSRSLAIKPDQVSWSIMTPLQRNFTVDSDNAREHAQKCMPFSASSVVQGSRCLTQTPSTCPDMYSQVTRLQQTKIRTPTTTAVFKD
jgi:hypothetical protein